jgi:hypothetical protein
MNLSSTGPPSDLQATLMGCGGCFALLGVVLPVVLLREGTGAGGTAH